MPNHCYNRVKIRTETFITLSQLKELLFKNDNFTMNKLLSMPKQLEDTSSPVKKPNKELIDKYSYDNWYDWRLNNWGTKWDAYDHYPLIETNFHIEQSFHTAWSPPKQFKNYLDQYIKDNYSSKNGYIELSWLWHDEGETIAGFL